MSHPQTIPLEPNWGSWSSISPTVSLIENAGGSNTHFVYYPDMQPAYSGLPNSIKVEKVTPFAWSDADPSGTPALVEEATISGTKYVFLADSRINSTGYSATDFNNPRAKFVVPSSLGGTSGGGGGGGFLSNNPKIENLTFTKTSDSNVNVSFDWENLDNYVVTNDRSGVIQTVSGSLSGSSGSESASVSLTCQEGDRLWIHGNYNNNSLEHHPDIHGSQSDPYIFRVVNFSVSGTTLTVSTFFHSSTGLNNDADFRVIDPDTQSWTRLDYINFDGTLQTKTVTPFTRGHTYHVVDRSTGNDYGMRFVAPGSGRRTRGRTFW